MPNTRSRSVTGVISAVLGLLFVLFSASVCLCQNSRMDALPLIKGKWVLKSIYVTQNAQGPSLLERRKLLGSVITFTAHSLISCGKSVPIRTIKLHTVQESQFLENTGVRFREVNLNNSKIEEVIINDRQSGLCLNAFPVPGLDIYIKGRNEILIDFEGIFYRALRKIE